VTYKQAQELGGQVRKGERGCPVVFWKFFERERDEGQAPDEISTRPDKVPMCRYYTVFNSSQCDGINHKRLSQLSEAPEYDHDPIAAAEQIVAAMPQRPPVEHGAKGAFYRPSSDKVFMPDKTRFRQTEAYYSTLFHELVHSTGHSKRLNRPGISEMSYFGSVVYSKEELLAEMGATFLCSAAGIGEQTLENSAGYIHGWLKKLKSDPKMVILAASAAQKAADFIRGEGSKL
jgi:antirestriction protein ArdC